MIGVLIQGPQRPDVLLPDGTPLGGLHCGDCFLISREGTWVSVRLECLDDWVLVEDNRISAIHYGALVLL